MKKIDPKSGKWTRKKGPKAPRRVKQGPKMKELGKRTLVDVIVFEGTIEDMGATEKKFNGDVEIEDIGNKNKEVVLENQHHRTQ